MEKLDEEILVLVQRGDMCGPKISAIAEKLGKSVPTIHRKIKKLEKEGVITEYAGHVDSLKVGKTVTALMWVKLEYPTQFKKTHASVMQKKVEYLAGLDEVMEINTIVGRWDLLLKVKANSLLDYYKFASDKIMPMGGITEMESTMMLKNFKERFYIPLK